MDNIKPSVQAFAIALRKLVESAAKDGGKSYDDLAERIRARQADGLIEEAIGYVPEGLETLPSPDAFKVVKHNGREGKQSSKLSKFTAEELLEKFG